MATTDVFTSSGSWTCPTGVTSAVVELWGAGGGGGANEPGLGGGGGAYSKKTLSVTPNNSYTVHVGDAANNNADGDDSYFNNTSTALAKGGKTGNDGTGQGGQASAGVGDTKYSGGNAGSGQGSGGGEGASSTADGHNGSAGPGGAGGTGGDGGDGGQGGNGFQNGFDGYAIGGGGGGAGQVGAGGGVSGRGEVRITYSTNVTVTLTASSGSFSLTGNAALFNKILKISASCGSFVFTGIVSTLNKILKIAISVGSFALMGIAAAFLEILDSPDGLADGWFNIRWPKRFRITPSVTDRESYVYNLAQAPDEFWNLVRSDGGDIRITDQDGETKLSRTVVGFDQEAREGSLTIPATGITSFLVYYANPSATEPL